MVQSALSSLAAVTGFALAIAAVPAAAQVACDAGLKSSAAGGASVVDKASNSNNLQQKSWQPAGGQIEFTVQSFVRIPADSEVMVCFRWRAKNDQSTTFVPTRPDRIDLSSDGMMLKVTTRVPDLWEKDTNVAKVYLFGLSWGIVPVADVRILAIHSATPPAAGATTQAVVGTAPQPVVVAAAMTSIGITRLWVADVITLIALAIALLLLYLVSLRALQGTPAAAARLALRVIATPKGYASLSQFQIMLWTLVVGLSAVYVMALSGELIAITTGTLILLGIAGAATVGSKAHSERQDARAQTPATPGAQSHMPTWSDLLVNEVRAVDAAGQPVVRREIDVTRVQMLFFTLITAAFVVIRVATTYVIPEIPDGFVTLMGISNGVYFGGKIAQSP